MARYTLVEVLAFLDEQGCVPTGDKLDAAIPFATASGFGFILPIIDLEWVDADLTDYILANQWIVPCAHALKRHEIGG
jgi:hypothetical protein